MEYKKQMGPFGKIVSVILVLIVSVPLVLIAKAAGGTYLALAVSFLIVGWLYKNVFKKQRLTQSDRLHEKEMEKVRSDIAPHSSKLVIVLLLLIAISILTFFYSSTGMFFIVLFFSILGYLAFFYRFAYGTRKSERRGAAETLGFTFSEKGDANTVHRQLLSLGSKASVSNVYQGNLEGFPCRIFDFYYVWMKKASYSATILEVTNVQTVPNMLILSKEDSFHETITPSKIFAGVSVDLEGDFSEYFSVFVQADAQNEIRQILTPDHMATLIDSMSTFSFLFFDEKVYIVLTDNSVHGFLKEHFLERFEQSKSIVQKWKFVLERM